MYNTIYRARAYMFLAHSYYTPKCSHAEDGYGQNVNVRARILSIFSSSIARKCHRPSKSLPFRHSVQWKLASLHHGFSVHCLAHVQKINLNCTLSYDSHRACKTWFRQMDLVFLVFAHIPFLVLCHCRRRRCCCCRCYLNSFVDIWLLYLFCRCALRFIAHHSHLFPSHSIGRAVFSYHIFRPLCHFILDVILRLFLPYRIRNMNMCISYDYTNMY